MIQNQNYQVNLKKYLKNKFQEIADLLQSKKSIENVFDKCYEKILNKFK